MRVNMDSSIVSDPRFKLVAQTLGVRHAEVIGCCYLLWLACYERRSERLSVRLANACADLSGFAEALISEGLCTDCGDGDMIVHGVEARISFLKKQAERGAKGGKTKKKTKAQANAKQTLPDRLSGDMQTAKANTPTLTPTLTPTDIALKAHSIPDDWKPNAKHVAKAEKLSIDCDDEAESYRNHALSKGRKLKNWDAGFHNWLKSSAEYRNKRNNINPDAPELPIF